MTELKFLGKRLKMYHGIDGTTPIHLAPGDCVGVSDDKAKRLLADFPHEFQATAGARKAEPETVMSESVPLFDEPEPALPKRNKVMPAKKIKRK